MDIAWLTYLNTFLWFAAVPVAHFVGKQWITRLVNHGFDEKLETLRSELREKEEKLKADLREKELALNALRASILSGSAGRQNLLDKRRFEAVEKVWTEVNELGQFLPLAKFMGTLNVKEIAAASGKSPDVQKFMDAVGKLGNPPDLKDWKSAARDERPFLTEHAWLLLSAYRAILFGCYTVFSILRTGVDEPLRFMNVDGVRPILREALPEFRKFIDDHGLETYHLLLEELQARLLAELRMMLDGKDVDVAVIKRTTELNRAMTEAFSPPPATAAG